MFAAAVCNLPATGGSIFVVFAGLFLLVAGVIVTRWVRQSSGRMSVVVAPLLLLGGLVLAPAVTDPCASTVTTVPGTTEAPTTTDAPTTTAPPESVVSNDNVLRAYAMSGDSGTWTGDTTDATTEEGEPYSYSGASSTVWFKWVATTDGQLVIDTCDTSFDYSLLVVYTIDDINNPWVTDPADGYAVLGGDFHRAGARCALPDQHEPAATTVDVTSGTTYYVQLSAYFSDANGPATLNWDFTPAVIDNRISNDLIVNAYDLGTADSGTWNGNTSTADMEMDEPYFNDGEGSDSGNNSVWFKFVAWNDGQLVVDSCNTSFDSVLSAYSISDISDPWNDYSWITDDDVSATCEGSDSANYPAQVRVGVTEGQTYYIQLDGYYGPGDNSPGDNSYFGQAQLNWSFNPLTNDDVADAYDLSQSNSGSWTGDTTSATVETGEMKNITLGAPHSTVWFKWVATASGPLTVDTCNTLFDSVLSLYTIGDISDPWNEDTTTYIFGDDSSADCSLQEDPAVITVGVTEGITYYFQLDSYCDPSLDPSDPDYCQYSGPAQVNWSFNVPI